MRLLPAFVRSGLLAVALLALGACDRESPARVTATAATQGATAATPATPAERLVAGVDYVEIPGGTPFEGAPGTVEVAEVFGYSCPHCAAFEPALQAWRARQPENVRLVPIPAPFGGYWLPYARAYYAAEQLGLAERTHPAVFDAVHRAGVLPAPPSVATDEQLATFYSGHGADPERFVAAMHSPDVEARLGRAAQFVQRAGVDGTPTLVVNGRYRVLGRSPEDVLRIVDALVARERAAMR